MTIEELMKSLSNEQLYAVKELLRAQNNPVQEELMERELVTSFQKADAKYGGKLIRVCWYSVPATDGVPALKKVCIFGNGDEGFVIREGYRDKEGSE